MADPVPETINRDQTSSAVNLCSDLMAASVQLMSAVRNLIALKERKERSGMDLEAAANANAIAASALKHATATDFNNAISSAVALKTWLDSNFHTDNFDALHP